MLFYDYKSHGYFLKELHFDRDYWLNLENTLVLFYKEFYLKVMSATYLLVCFLKAHSKVLENIWHLKALLKR